MVIQPQNCRKKSVYTVYSPLKCLEIIIVQKTGTFKDLKGAYKVRMVYVSKKKQKLLDIGFKRGQTSGIRWINKKFVSLI